MCTTIITDRIQHAEDDRPPQIAGTAPPMSLPHTARLPVMLVTAILVSALIALVVIVREFRAGELTWDIGSYFLIVIGAAFELGLFVAKLTGSKYSLDLDTGLRSLETSRWESVVPSHQVTITLAVSLALALALASRRKLKIPIPAALWIGFIVLALAVDFVRYGNIPSGEPILMLAGIVGACAASRTRAGAIAGAAMFVLGLCIAGAMIAVLNPDSVLQECTVKCNMTDFIYSGASNHGNSFGLILAVGLPFVWLAFNGKSRLILVGYVLFNLVLTGSRTSIIAGLVALALLALTNPGIRGNIVRGAREFVTLSAVLGAAATSLIVPYVVTNPNFATGRGRLWNLAQHLANKNLWFGQGSTSWFREYSAGSFGRAAAYSSHNQWVEVTLFLGVVGVAIFAWIICGFMTSGDNRFLVAPVLVAIFVLGITERPIALALVDLMSWALFALIMVLSADQTSSSKLQQAEGHRHFSRPDEVQRRRWVSR